MRLRTLVALAIVSGILGTHPGASTAQSVEREVRQLVSFVFTPGDATEARAVFAEMAIPLYEQDQAMRRFRALREIESPVPVDLIVVSSFDGMAGMDRSNAALRTLETESGTGIGDFYGRIGPLIAEHTDHFVEMLSESSAGSPYDQPRTVLMRYRVVPGKRLEFEAAIAYLEQWEAAEGIPAETGRFLVSDGYDYMRWIGLDSLGSYQEYWAALDQLAISAAFDEITAMRTEMILAPVPELFVR